jgi:hypothetical protein
VLLQHGSLRKVFLDIVTFTQIIYDTTWRPSCSMRMVIKDAVMQAIAQQEKWLGIEDSEAGEHPRWRLTEGPTDGNIGFLVRE